MKQPMFYGLATVLMLGLAPNAHADIVNYGNFDAGRVGFLNVTEVTPQSCLFFGAPVIAEDALVFMATSADGSNLTSTSQLTSNGFDFANGALSLVLQADPGYEINEIRVRHFGSLSTFGDDSLAMVDSIGFATVGTQVYSGSFHAEASGNQLGNFFDQTYAISFPAARQVILSIQDQLFTVADDGPGFAFVNTQGVIIESFSVSAVPEPGTLVGMTLLVGCLLVRRVRKPGFARTPKLGRVS